MKAVGPILQAGPVSDAIVAVARRTYPDVESVDRGSYVRVTVAGECKLSRAAIEKELGRPFHLPTDLEQVMISFQGRFSFDEDEARWSSS